MSGSQQPQAPLHELNKEVHDLHYVEPGKTEQRKITPDRSLGWELAKRIRKNIEAYNADAHPRPDPQAQ